MGLKFRKSAKVAPGVRVNLSKKSTSVTLGSKGVRHTVSSSGKKTTSVGVPGTGLSYVSTSSARKGTSKNSRSKTDSHVDKKESTNTTPKNVLTCLTCVLLGILCVFLLMVLIFIIIDPSTELTGIEVTWTANEYIVNDSTEVTISPVPDSANIESLTLSENSIASTEYKDGKIIVTFYTVGSEELYFIANEEINSDPQLINVINQDIIAEEVSAEQTAQTEADISAEQAAQAEAERIAAEQSETQQQSQEQMVWISDTGSKYHSKPDCGKMDPNKAYQMSVSEAESQGYSACSKCH